ncbi:hypothetical protein Tsubulata_037114 [Turnera subulata]|uniref:Uncharacterized protein n=1 Tax=Turnera subulata TaxID=218843 RepID=A0A9Q0G756_9ROSI|nr:hypothetical protein Tsubulata_037114 [Turnera subulata]
MANDFPEYKDSCIYLTDPLIPSSPCHRCGYSAIAIFDLEDGLVKSWCEYYGCEWLLPTWHPEMLRPERKKKKFHYWVRRVLGLPCGDQMNTF